MRIFKLTNFKGRLCELKAWLEKGQGLTYLPKYLILLLVVAEQDITNALSYGVGYAVLVFIIGFIWYKFDMIKWEIEVGNVYDKFVIEMREKFK